MNSNSRLLLLFCPLQLTIRAVKEFSQYGQHRLAQIAAQIMGVEAEHRGLGRSISSSYPMLTTMHLNPHWLSQLVTLLMC